MKKSWSNFRVNPGLSKKKLRHLLDDEVSDDEVSQGPHRCTTCGADTEVVIEADNDMFEEDVYTCLPCRRFEKECTCNPDEVVGPDMTEKDRQQLDDATREYDYPEKEDV